MLSVTVCDAGRLEWLLVKEYAESGCSGKLGPAIGVWGGVSPPSKLNIRSGRVGPGPGVGGRGHGGPPASDIMAMGVVGGLGGEMTIGAPAVGMGGAAGAAGGVVVIEESVSCPPTGGCGVASSRGSIVLVDG